MSPCWPAVADSSRHDTMTTYLFSEIDDGDALAFDPLNDIR
jgi:hypothetical protein